MIMLSATNYVFWTKDGRYPILQGFVRPIGESGRQICSDEWWEMEEDEPKREHEVFHHVVQETSAYELWTKLEEIYQAKTSHISK